MNTHPVIDRIFTDLLSQGRVISIDTYPNQIKTDRTFITSIQSDEGGIKNYFESRLKENDRVAIFSTPFGDNQFSGICVYTQLGMIFLIEVNSRSPHSGAVSKHFFATSTDLLFTMKVGTSREEDPADIFVNKFNLHGGIQELFNFVDSVANKITEVVEKNKI